MVNIVYSILFQKHGSLKIIVFFSFQIQTWKKEKLWWIGRVLYWYSKINSFENLRQDFCREGKMQLQILLSLTIIFLLLVLDEEVDCCKQFYRKTEQKIWFVEETTIHQKKSLVQCLLMCSGKRYECDMAGYLPTTEECILYAESTQRKIFDDSDGIDLYAPKKPQQVQQVISTHSPPYQSHTNAYNCLLIQNLKFSR